MSNHIAAATTLQDCLADLGGISADRVRLDPTPGLEYFHSHVQVVWVVDCINRSVAVYDSPSKFKIFSEEETIDGGEGASWFHLSSCRLLPRS